MTSHTSIEIGLKNCKTFTPSYEREEESTVPFTPPSLPEKFLAGILTATVWTGIIFTLPVAYFWVFKKENKDEKILVRRLGKLQSTFTFGGRVPVLPLIDEEIRIDTSEQTSKIETSDIVTIDKCCIRANGTIKWNIQDSVKADSKSANAKQDTERLLNLYVNKQLAKSFVRQVATEKEKIERKIYWILNDELEKIGIRVNSVELEFKASQNQPFINSSGPVEPAMGGIGGAIQSANQSGDMVSEMLAGFIGHPGFSNIISSVIHTVEEHVAKSNEHSPDGFDPQSYDATNTESAALLEPSMSTILELIKTKKRQRTPTQLLIIGSGGEDLYLDPRYEIPQIVRSGTKSGECSIKIKNSILAKILQKQLSYKEAFANGEIQIEGDAHQIRHLLPFLN